MSAFTLLAVLLTVVPGNNMPLVEASLDGAPCTLLVDTGASHTTFDLAFITNRLPKAELQDVALMGSTNVRTPPKFVSVTNLTVGTTHYQIEGVMALDLAHLSRGVGRRVDGILGMNHLGEVPCVISLGRGELIFNPDVAELKDFHPVLTRSRGTTFELIVKLPSGEIVPFLVDTGSSFTFVNRELWPEAKREIKLGTSDVNENQAQSFILGESGQFDCGHGFKLPVSPVLTAERNRNQIGSDVFKTVDLAIVSRELRLRRREK